MGSCWHERGHGQTIQVKREHSNSSSSGVSNWLVSLWVENHGSYSKVQGSYWRLQA